MQRFEIFQLSLQLRDSALFVSGCSANPEVKEKPNSSVVDNCYYLTVVPLSHSYEDVFFRSVFGILSVLSYGEKENIFF